MQPFKSRLAYVVTHCFLRRIWERTEYEDLVVLLSGMCLSLDGERSMDPAMVYDWAKATSGEASFTRQEGFEAAKAFLQYWYEIGPQDEIKNVIESMETSCGEPVRTEIVGLWDTCWNEVSANVEAGHPFKTAFCYATNRDGKAGRLQRNAGTGFHEFVEN